MALLRHLVVIVPGIGGSVLLGTASAGEGSARYALSIAGLARVMLSPGLLDLDNYPDLYPVDLVDDFTALAPLLTLPGYRRLSLHLAKAFDRLVIDTYRPPVPISKDADVLRFPYDFRRSVAETAQRLDEAVDEALSRREAAGGSRQVIVVAHSMGGLVARYWAAVLGGWQHCDALIFMGTPHRGAPKALDWLINGVGLGSLRYPRATRVIRGWPSVYELLPQYPAVTTGQAGPPLELTELPPELLVAQPELASYARQFAEMAAAGREVHERIAECWAGLDPVGQVPRIVPFMGRGHATLNMAVLDGGRFRVSKTDPPWRGNVGWRGDGTVPMLSAIPRELSDRQDLWRVMPDRHGALASIPEPVNLLQLYAGDHLPVRGGELPERPWLGLDFDEFALAGADFPVEVMLLPEGLRGETASVMRSPLNGTPGEAYRARLSPSEPGLSEGMVWRGTLPGCAQGRYELAVEVAGVPGQGQVSATSTVVVLDEMGAAHDVEGQG